MADNLIVLELMRDLLTGLNREAWEQARSLNVDIDSDRGLSLIVEHRRTGRRIALKLVELPIRNETKGTVGGTNGR